MHELISQLISPFLFPWQHLHWWVIPIGIVVWIALIIFYEIYVKEAHMRR